MSEENVEIVRRIYDAFNRDDPDAVFRHAHPDLAVTFKEGPRAGTHRGRDVLQEVADDLRHGFEYWIFEPLKLIDSEDQVVAIINNRLRPKGGSSGEFSYRNGSIFTIRDGMVLSMVGYPTPEEALEAAGLGE